MSISISLLFLSLPVLAQMNLERETLGAQAPSSFRLPIGISLFSLVSQEELLPGREIKGPRSISSYNFLSFNYNLDGERRLSLRVPWVHNSAGQNRFGDEIISRIMLSDIHVQYSSFDIGYLGDLDLSGNIKYYFPNSVNSQQTKSYGRARFEVYAEYGIGRYSSLTYIIKQDTYFQSQRAYFNNLVPQFNDGSFVTDPRQTNRQFSLEHYLQFSGNINRYFGVQLRAGFLEDWNYSSAAEDLPSRHTTSTRNGVGLEIRAARGYNFLVMLQNDSRLNTGSNGAPVKLFQPENNSVILISNIRLY